MTIADIKKLIGSKNLIIGTDLTLKKLRSNKVKRIWLSANVPSTVQDSILGYSKLNKVKLEKLKIPNDELGILCKKQFSVSMVSEGE